MSPTSIGRTSVIAPRPSRRGVASNAVCCSVLQIEDGPRNLVLAADSFANILWLCHDIAVRGVPEKRSREKAWQTSTSGAVSDLTVSRRDSFVLRRLNQNVFDLLLETQTP